MNDTFNTVAAIEINAPAEDIWQAFVNPDIFKEWMFGATVTSDWKKGSSLTYTGEWNGKPFEDKGVILEIIPNKLLKATYFSPLSGKEDIPENYQTITYKIDESTGGFKVTIIQENNPTQEVADKASSDWEYLLKEVKTLVEKR